MRVERNPLAGLADALGCSDKKTGVNPLAAWSRSGVRAGLKDRIRARQVCWLEAALHCGCAVEDFLVVEWSLSPITSPHAKEPSRG